MYSSIDIFAGCGGFSEGLKRAGFDTKLAVELEQIPADVFKANHPDVDVVVDDIKNINFTKYKSLKKEQIHVLVGGPPCQGFSVMRRKNKKKSVKDKRNSLIMEYSRVLEEIMPMTFVMENVPGLLNYYLFDEFIKRTTLLGYNIDYKVVNIKNFGVPQSRKRLIVIGSLLGHIEVPLGLSKIRTVRQTIGHLDSPDITKDPLQKIIINHNSAVMERIKLTPKDGGSRKDLPEKYKMNCHKTEGIGFSDVYGRLRWDSVSSTITGGCLNPSKGRFLHPEQDRVITPREASLLQSFPENYIFPTNISKQKLALMIGNALPPLFGFSLVSTIKNHLDQFV